MRYVPKRTLDILLWFKSILTIFIGRFDLVSGKKSLLNSDTLGKDDKALLEKISYSIHRNDSMYMPLGSKHYLSVGLSAIHCIEAALEKSGNHNPLSNILDFPCGYGRVLRFLRVKFPSAKLTMAEINQEALAFCKKAFSVDSVLSESDFTKIHLPVKFDLIWCGSLLTHLNEESASGLLKFFHDHLADGGLCVFTTHGAYSAEMIRNGDPYRLHERNKQPILSQFEERGYGYADYFDNCG